MRVLIVAMAALTAACGGTPVQTEAPEPLWRRTAAYVAADRELARACLLEAQGGCEGVIQQACAGEDDFDPESQWLCDWRAIAAWEDEMESMLRRLREKLEGRDLRNLDASQRAWEASMAAHVRLVMYEGGSLSSRAGAQVRARATAQRAQDLADMLRMVD